MYMRILIGADGCPITGLTVRIADKYNIKVIIVCDRSYIFDFEKAKRYIK